MTLRTDIRNAYDEIIPAAPALQPQIRMIVAAEGKTGAQSRYRRGPWLASLRGTTAVVAALLVVLIIATVLVGGRVWHDWSVFTNRPAPAGQIDPVQLAALEARPLHLPVVKPGEDCPAGPYGSYWGFGDGPVSFVYGVRAYSTWGTYVRGVTSTDYRLAGLVLGRARDLVSGAPVVFVGKYAAGPIVGVDTVEGSRVQQHYEVVLDANHPPLATQDSGKLVVWGLLLGFASVARDSSGCIGFQFDGPSFSQTFVTPP